MCRTRGGSRRFVGGFDHRGPLTRHVWRRSRAIREAVGDSETWRIHTEDEILSRYAKGGLALRSLDDIGEAVPLRAADKLAIALGAGPPGNMRQLRNRRRFRGRLSEEVEQLIGEACIPLVHNAAVYGCRGRTG